jgi:DNA-directed RNA polymerase subunit M/transcription elongation factor TFIIS
MSKFKIYKAELKKLSHNEVMKITKNIPLEERIEPCPVCGGTEFWLHPDECAAVQEGMKPYGECMDCGMTMHL